MPYPVLAVANYFLDLAAKDGKQLTNMQLQKLVYFAHGWCLGLSHKPLVREHVEAWPYGPVFPELYDALKQYGGEPVTGYASFTELVTDPKTGRQTLGLSTPTLHGSASPYDIDLIKRIWNVYGGFSAAQLSEATHEAGGPWQTTLSGSFGRIRTEIPDPTIEKYFEAKATGTA